MPDRLTEQAKVLADRVGALSLAVEQLDRRTNRGEKAVVAVVVVLVLTLTLSVVVAFTLLQQRQTQRDVQGAIDRETRTREEALCPLYGLILGSYNPASRPEGDARNTYIQQFQVMRNAYESLDCQGPLIPPPSRQPAPTVGPR
jgi:hypothetical protein